MKVRKKNPLLEARQLTRETVEDVVEWARRGRNDIQWRRGEDGEGEPYLFLGEDSGYAYCGEWIVSFFSGRVSKFEVWPDDKFKTEFVDDDPPFNFNEVAMMPGDPDMPGFTPPVMSSFVDHDQKEATRLSVLTGVPLDNAGVEKVNELDRNARAYGWEIGNGAEMGAAICMSPENPFNDSEWREKC